MAIYPEYQQHYGSVDYDLADTAGEVKLKLYQSCYSGSQHRVDDLVDALLWPTSTRWKETLDS